MLVINSVVEVMNRLQTHMGSVFSDIRIVNKIIGAMKIFPGYIFYSCL